MVCMRTKHGILAAGLLAAALGLGCRQKKVAAPPPLSVEVAPVIEQDVAITRDWVGSLDGSVNADIRPQVEGYLLRQVYKEGSAVRKGQLLFEIDPRSFNAALEEAKAALVRNQALLAKAEHDVDRFRPLAEEKAVSQQELDDAIAARREAKANVDAAQAAVAKARLNLEWTHVNPPIDGIAGIAKTDVGDLVNGQTIMTTVSTIDPIKVLFEPSEQEYRLWRERNINNTGSLQLFLSDGSRYPLTGDMELADRGVDVKTGTITLEGLFPNPDHALLPGQFARVRAVLETRKNALLIPQRAISELQGNDQVAVVDDTNKVHIRPVEMGERIGNLWVVQSGLKAGDRVVVEGTQKVAEGTSVKPTLAVTGKDSQGTLAIASPETPGGVNAPREN